MPLQKGEDLGKISTGILLHKTATWIATVKYTKTQIANWIQLPKQVLAPYIFTYIYVNKSSESKSVKNM